MSRRFLFEKIVLNKIPLFQYKNLFLVFNKTKIYFKKLSKIKFHPIQLKDCNDRKTFKDRFDLDPFKIKGFASLNLR